jgi:hypothetical protein
MGFYWWAVIIGLILPWFVIGQTLRVAFTELSIVTGLGYWLGAALIAVPVTLLMFWFVAG